VYSLTIYPRASRDSKESRSAEIAQRCIALQQEFLKHSLDYLKAGFQSLTLVISPNLETNPQDKLRLRLGFKFENAQPGFEDSLNSFLQISGLLDFYQMEFAAEPCLSSVDLGWVSCIGEILKYEQSHAVISQDYYLPHGFEPNFNNDAIALFETLCRLTEPCLLTVTLEPILPQSHSPEFLKAVQQKIAQLQLALKHHKDPFLSAALKQYQTYQATHLRNTIFRYSIKAHTQTAVAARTVLRQYLRCATTPGKAPETGHIEIVTAQDHLEIFQASLAATQHQEIVPVIEWEGWRSGLAQKSIRPPLQARMNQGLGDSSTKLPSPGTRLNPTLGSLGRTALPSAQPGNSSSAIVSAGSSALAPRNPSNSAFQPAQIQDLKPLHRLANLEEISSFFRLPIAIGGSVPGIVPPKPKVVATCTAEALLEQYRHLITPDTYIVGLDPNGTPVVSNWSEIPHRLVAGVPGAGKSNFLNWVIFQFLLANPSATLYLSDFKGVDFNHLNQLNRPIAIVHDVASCQELLETIEEQEAQRRLKLMQEYGVANIQELREELQAEGQEIARTLWIIDEAADIADESNKLKNQVENQLKRYARKGRSFGIHVMYCTQRPDASVITKQVTDQCEEKIVFRVSADASYRILSNEAAVNQATGQCILGNLPIIAASRS
jgi:hypothetical protein